MKSALVFIDCTLIFDTLLPIPIIIIDTRNKKKEREKKIDDQRQPVKISNNNNLNVNTNTHARETLTAIDKVRELLDPALNFHVYLFLSVRCPFVR